MTKTSNLNEFSGPGGVSGGKVLCCIRSGYNYSFPSILSVEDILFNPVNPVTANYYAKKVNG